MADGAAAGEGRSPSPFEPEAATAPGCWNWMATVALVAALGGLAAVPWVWSTADAHAVDRAPPLPPDAEPPAAFAQGMDGAIFAIRVVSLWLCGLLLLVGLLACGAAVITARRRRAFEQETGSGAVT